MTELILTIAEDNLASQKVAEANGAVTIDERTTADVKAAELALAT
jgi:predicted acetyltransferase